MAFDEKSLPDEKESVQRLQTLQSSILSAIPHALVGLKERTIFFANEAVEEVFGWKIDELVGKNTRVLYRTDAEYEEIGMRFYTMLEKQRTHIEDFPCRRKDGREIICKMSASVIGKKLADKGIVIMYEDVTRLKKVESDLIESEQKYRALFENSGTAMFITEGDVNISLANAGAEKISGYSRSEIEWRMSWKDFIPEEDFAMMQSYLASTRRNPRAASGSYESRLIDKHGDIRQISLIIAHIPGTNKGIASITDITERKKAEAEIYAYRNHLEELVKERTLQLETANKELEQSNTKLQELDRLKSLFIASMSHELRTPLNSIIGFTGILLQGLPGPLNDEQKKQLGMVKGSSQHLLELITDIIDLSKIEAGKIEVSPSEFDLMKIIREIGASLGPAAERKHIVMTLDGPDTLLVKSDQRRIRQVLVNLMSNAVKYTEQGEVQVVASANAGAVQVAVRDTGPGIRAEDMGRLFQFFSRITSADMPSHEGTGLGLYLSKKLMALLKGDITAVSDFGKGSIFTMTLPLSIKEEP